MTLLALHRTLRHFVVVTCKLWTNHSLYARWSHYVCTSMPPVVVTDGLHSQPDWRTYVCTVCTYKVLLYNNLCGNRCLQEARRMVQHTRCNTYVMLANLISMLDILVTSPSTTQQPGGRSTPPSELSVSDPVLCGRLASEAGLKGY